MIPIPRLIGCYKKFDTKIGESPFQRRTRERNLSRILEFKIFFGGGIHE